MAARGDDDVARPAVLERRDRLRHVALHDPRAAEALRIGELGPVLENRDVEIEQHRLPRDGERDVAAARDDELRTAGDGIDQEIVRVVEGDQAGRRVRQLGHRRGRSALVERRVAETARHRDTRGINEQPAREVDRPALPAEQRRDGERRSAGRRPHEIAQHRSTADREGVFAAFGQDPHRAAADETGVPGQLLGQLISPK